MKEEDFLKEHPSITTIMGKSPFQKVYISEVIRTQLDKEKVKDYLKRFPAGSLISIDELKKELGLK